MATAPPRKFDWLAALLSYVIPGLGQIYQGRVGKGILFLASLYVLFFYGMALGSWKNVYIAHTDKRQNTFFQSTVLGDLENRLHFVGQFWIGAAAWPAIVQYATFDPDKPTGVIGNWQREPREDRGEGGRGGNEWTTEKLNATIRNSDKNWDLGWVYTVIAGALNFLVIFDALAGPAVRESAQSNTKEAVAA